jgi:hypothetical protein
MQDRATGDKKMLDAAVIDRCAAKATFVLGDQGQVGFRQEGS